MIGLFGGALGPLRCLGCPTPLACQAGCAHFGGWVHGNWSAATAANGSAVAGAGGADPGALAAALAQQNALAHQNAFAQLAQACPQTVAQLAQAQQQALVQQGLIGGLGDLGLFGQVEPPPILPPLERAGIELGEVIGWRCWRVRPGLVLESWTMGCEWRPDAPMTGTPGGHDGCGVWAFTDRAAAAGKVSVESSGCRAPAAGGAVRLWGELIEHEIGFRAEHARIVAIEGVVGGRGGLVRRRLLRQLRARYAVGSFADYEGAGGSVEPGR